HTRFKCDWSSDVCSSDLVYAESWIRAGAEDHLCVDVVKLAFTKAQALPSGGAEQNACGDGKVPAEAALKHQELYDALVDAFSMRSEERRVGKADIEQVLA